ncbi:MAG TPA: hypothetical protein VE984_05880 [Gaiellaceae bacterium]|nr:hypothetical protein [Gaiellaceae bacterium]
MARLKEQVSGEPPEGLDAKSLLVLHEPESEEALAVVIFEDEEAYRRGNEILDSMPASDTPGNRTSVRKYEVAVHREL